jgi:type II secretory pathway pseudopilin PulG
MDISNREKSRALSAPPVLTPHSRLGDTSGFTVLEIVVVLAILAFATGAFLASTRPSTERVVDEATRIFAAHLESGLARARAQEQDAAIAVRSGTSDRRYVILLGTPPPSPTSVAASDWTELPEGVLWSAGDAVRTPFGATISSPPPLPALVDCTSERCAVPGRDAALYYLTHEKDPAIVGAVSLSYDGSVQVYRYHSGSRTWSALAR